MNGPRIQQDERGITVNKSLAWTMVVGLISAGLFLGNLTASTQAAVESLAEVQTQRHTETLTFRRDTETRIRILESARSATDSENTGMRRDIQEIKTLLRAIEQSIARVPR